MDLKKALEVLNDGLKSELRKAYKIEGPKLESFKTAFNLEYDPDIYANTFNLIITDPETNEKIGSVLKREQLILCVEVKSFNAYLWVYDVASDPLIDNLLNY